MSSGCAVSIPFAVGILRPNPFSTVGGLFTQRATHGIGGGSSTSVLTRAWSIRKNKALSESLISLPFVA